MGSNQSKRIATAVTDYVNRHINTTFTARELRMFVASRVDGVAPASSDRIMRQLRQTKKINYELVSRSKSLYRGLSFVVADPVVGSPEYNETVNVPTASRFRSDRPNGCGGETV